MATAAAATNQVAMADLKGKVDPDWCPGCGDFGVLAAVQKALVELQIPTPQRGYNQRHRLLVQLPRLHQYLRHAHSARPRAGGSHRCEAGKSRSDCVW